MNFGNNKSKQQIIATEEYSNKTIAHMETAASAYDKSNFSKWSDCTFETPFVPPLGLESNANALQANAEKMRKNMFENSYFSDFKSLPGITPFNAETALSGNANRSSLTAQQQPMVSIQAKGTSVCFYYWNSTEL